MADEQVCGTREHAVMADAASPLFSVATPTRNDLAKLRRCIGSVRGQQGATVEHLVQDACSSDGTPEWLAKQLGLRAVSEADRGMYDAIHRGWARSRGRYLSWLNADEQYLPGTLAFVHQWFEANPKAPVLFGDYLVARPDGTAVALRREIPFRRTYVVNGFLNTTSCSLFFRRELWDKGMLRFDDKLRYAADKDLMLRLHAAGIPIVHVPRVLAIFGIDGTNLSTHDQMSVEAEQVRLRHGALRSAMLRRLVLLGRSAERLMAGGYRRQDFDYRFALDEQPSYRDFTARGLGGRYTLADGIEPTTQEA
jgi:glycosyltransferase involved in cell wall biosynthesis